MLNVGLLVAALFHILELGALLAEEGVEVGGVWGGEEAAVVASRGRAAPWLLSCPTTGCAWPWPALHRAWRPCRSFLTTLLGALAERQWPGLGMTSAGSAPADPRPGLPPAPSLQSRWLLPFLFTHWLLVLIAAIVGLR